MCSHSKKMKMSAHHYSHAMEKVTKVERVEEEGKVEKVERGVAGGGVNFLEANAISSLLELSRGEQQSV